MSKKPIIAFEGVEGSGKSHHIAKISKYFDKKKIKYLKIREPGGNLNSEKIRKLILSNKSDFNQNTDLLLYMAARSENMNLIRKFHKKRIILIDRFTDSTIAYQHYGMKIDLEIINKINKFLLGNIKVDFTFLNIINQKNLILRLKKRKSLNRYDKFNLKFYENVQKGFMKIARLKKKSYKIINSNLEIKKNENLILDKIQKLI
jgi:dTMP kinase